jgi:hypothetical protein
LRWSPDSGFALDAVVAKRDLLQPIRRVDIPSGPEIPVVTNARVDLGDFGWAMTPVHDLKQNADFISGSVVTLRSAVALFRHRDRGGSGTGSKWRGGATLRVLPRTILPDPVVEEVTIAGRRARHTVRRAGLDVQTEDLGLRAEFCEPDTVVTSWSLTRQAWPKGADWRFGEALRYALGILMGQRSWLLRRRTARPAGEYEEVRWMTRPAEDLGVLAPLGQSPFFNKEHLVALLGMLGRSGSNAFIARCIFDQLADAAQQATWQARELLTATILEAVMRRVYDKPFEPGPSWDFSEPLRRYCGSYLGEAWVTVADRVHATHKRLRHRNAHPDWTLEKEGAVGKRVEASVDDLILLSRFYGYLILSMAGVRDLQPRFPRPHKEWPPLFTVLLGDGLKP